MADRHFGIAPDVGRSARLAQESTLPWGRIGVSDETARGLGVPNPRGTAPAAQQPRSLRVARWVPWLNLGLTIAEALHAMAGPVPVLRTEIAIAGVSDLAVVIYGRSYPGTQAGTAMFVRGVGGPSLGVTAVVASDGLHFDADALQRAYGKPLPRVLAPAGVAVGGGQAKPTVLENRPSDVHDNLDTDGATARRLVSSQARFHPWQAHHLIPFAEVAKLPEPVQLAIAESGWLMDAVENLIALPGDATAYNSVGGVLPYHRGPHPRYNAEVAERLSHLRRAATTMSAAAIRAELRMIEGFMFQRLLDRQRGYHPRVSMSEYPGASAAG